MEALVSVLIGYRFKGCWNSTDGLYFVSTSQGNISKSQMFMTDCIICFSSRVHPSWLQQANVFPPKASQTQCISSWWMHCVKTQLYDDISLLCVLSQPNTHLSSWFLIMLYDKEQWLCYSHFQHTGTCGHISLSISVLYTRSFISGLGCSFYSWNIMFPSTFLVIWGLLLWGK